MFSSTKLSVITKRENQPHNLEVTGSLAYVSGIKTENYLSKLLFIVSPANRQAKFGTVLNIGIILL